MILSLYVLICLMYRPISLCSVTYKNVSKVIVNRLKDLMPVCIAENQSTCVPGRIIYDNIMIAHELLHYLKGSRNGPNKGVDVKLDMEKAYDRVEWHFPKDVMGKMGFVARWIDLVMKCITSVSYCINVNGQVSEFFRPSRGLRQGDPLSPYLFLFCTQGLSALLLKEQSLGNIKGIRASQNGPRITHLLYADDCLLFLKNSPREAYMMKDILSCYEYSLGHKMNVDKSYIYYSNGMIVESEEMISSILNMRDELEVGNYLGLPLIVGKSKMQALGFLTESVDKRVNGWTKNLLSFGGREVLLKVVAHALPAYAMGCFLLPECILDPIINTMRGMDVHKVKQVFSVVDANSILNCPTNPAHEDIQVWGNHTSGIYNVKSVYRWISSAQALKGDSSTIWKNIAAMPTLPKIKNFAWRLCYEAFPLVRKLAYAGLATRLCSMCQESVETGLHAFRDCSSIREAFDLCNLNKWIHDAQLIPHKLVVDYAQLLSADFLNAQETTPNLNESIPQDKWSRPLQNNIKINVDGAFNPTSRKATIGVIARNSYGMMIDGCAFQLRGLHTTDSAEACAFKEGVKLAISNGWTHVIFEEDAYNIVSKLERKDLDHSLAAYHLLSTVQVLADYPDFSFAFVRRALNRAAHGLAQWVVNVDVNFRFDYEITSCIEHFVIEDAIYG
ncbi:hypothetical protein GQ457_08G017500 [Hibiscus cannabinus]